MKKFLITIIFLLAISLIGTSVYLIYTGNGTGSNSEETNTKNESEETNTKKDTDNVKEKIDHFIEIGTYSDVGSAYLTKVFYDGVTELTKEQKLEMAYLGVYLSKNFTKVEEVPEKYKDSEQFKDLETVGYKEMSISEYEKEYKYLFNEEIGEYEATEITGCPHPFLKDEELDAIYMSSQCGGTGNPEYKTETISETEEDGYHIITQKAGYNDDLKEIVWKFDKDGNFVSTTNNG